MLSPFWPDPAFRWDGEQNQHLLQRQALIIAELIGPFVRLFLAAADKVSQVILERVKDLALTKGKPLAGSGFIPLVCNLGPTRKLLCPVEDISGGTELRQLSADEQEQMLLTVSAPGDQVAEPVVQRSGPFPPPLGPSQLQASPVGDQGCCFKARFIQIEPQRPGLLQCSGPSRGQV